MCRSKYDPNIRDTLIMTRNIALSFMVTDVLPVPTSYKLGSGNKYIDASMTFFVGIPFSARFFLCEVDDHCAALVNWWP